MKLAAIDIGTNSIHTVIVEIHGDGKLWTSSKIWSDSARVKRQKPA